MSHEILKKCQEIGAKKETTHGCFECCGPLEFIFPDRLPEHCLAKKEVKPITTDLQCKVLNG